MFTWGQVVLLVVKAWNATLAFIQRQQDRAAGAREAEAKQREEQEKRRATAQAAYDQSLLDNPDGLSDDRDLRD